MFVEGAKNGNYRSVSIAHSLRGAFFLGGAAPAVAGAGLQVLTFGGSESGGGGLDWDSIFPESKLFNTGVVQPYI